MIITQIEHPDKKFIESFFYGDSNEEWEVETDSGWVDIKAVGKTVEYQIYCLKTKKYELLCADEHIVFKKIDENLFQETFVINLVPNDIILTDAGEDIVQFVSETPAWENMYDLQLNNEEKRFYTNGILSHNSLFLCNLACAGVRQGYNVAYISLEMAESKIIKRLACNLLSIPSREYDVLSEDSSFIKKKFSNIATDALSVPGALRVKEFPTSTASVSDIENWMKRVEEKRRMKFNIVVIDYIGIMRNSRNPNSENSYMKIKQISEDLRAMAMRNNWCILTASQFNRCLDINTEVISRKGKILLKELKTGEEILTHNGWKRVKEISNTEKRKKVIIKTKSGKKIICSDIHVFPTDKGELMAKDIKEKMSLFKVSGRYIEKMIKDATEKGKHD